MAYSARGQDKANPMFWLAKWAGKVDPLGISRVGPARKGSLFGDYNKSFIYQVCSVKMAEYWPRFFPVFIDLDFASAHNRELK